jgi:hypothetical protein
MSGDERIEAALGRQPADERDYSEPLTPLTKDEGVQRRPVRPVTRPRVRPRTRTGVQPALLALAVVVALGATAVAVGVWRSPASPVSGSGNDYQLTGRFACFGQGPGGTIKPGMASDDCPHMAVPPDDLEAATWTLDPAVSYSAAATEIHILVTEWACHSDLSAEGRIEQNVQYRDAAVVVTLAIRRPSGDSQTCPGTPPTPFVVRIAQPVGLRDLNDGGRWPAYTVARGGLPVVSPTPTSEPSNWHMPMDCTGEADGPGSFKAASMSAPFDVYCAVLPAGWHRESMSGDEQAATVVAVVYRGPNGETFALTEGDLCSLGADACATGGTKLENAMFGDRDGQLVGAPPGADYALYVAPGQSPSWKATGKGMTVESFRALTGALIMVAK